MSSLPPAPVAIRLPQAGCDDGGVTEWAGRVWPETAEALMRSRFVREEGRWYYLDATDTIL